MKVYKVVKRTNGKLVSAIVEGEAMVEYKPNVWVAAPEWLRKRGYHLFAFKDLGYAMCFRSAPTMEIWLAKAKGVTEKLPRYLNTSLLAHGEIEKGRWFHLEGTVMCKQIKLIERIPLEP